MVYTNRKKRLKTVPATKFCIPLHNHCLNKNQLLDLPQVNTYSKCKCVRCKTNVLAIQLSVFTFLVEQVLWCNVVVMMSFASR